MTDAAFQLLGDAREWTLSRVLRRQAARQGGRRFARFGDGPVLSFQAFDTQADQVAQALLSQGLDTGDRVLCMLRNRVEFILLAVACGRAGLVFVPVNTELKGYSLQHQLHNCSARLVVLEAELLPHFEGVQPAAQAPVAVVLLGDTRPVNLPPALGAAPAQAWAGFLAQARPAVLHDPAPHELACIMYTSGTTGPAKGVLMPHAHLALFSVPAAGLGLCETDVYYVCMPLFHANALFTQVFASLLLGAQVQVVERFSPTRWLPEVRACGATVTNALGIMSEMLFKTPQQPDDAANTLRSVLAVPVADWVGQFMRRFGVQVVQGYGMTECNMAAYAQPGDPCVPGCAGSLRPDLFEVRILDPETDTPLPDGQVGEICIRPRVPFAFMQGYFGMPDKTAEAWRNLWFHTGDAGRIEAGRHLHFQDRIKDRIRRRGENVSAFEIEQVLSQLPGVAEAAVVGVRVGDAASEQEIKACIVRTPGEQGAALTALQVLQHCVAQVPRFAVPRFIEFVPALPKTASNKVQKHVLRESGAHQAWDREAEGHGVRRVERAKESA